MIDMQPKWSFREVLNNGDDQVIVRELLEEYVPTAVKLKIIIAFNVHVAAYNLRLKTIEASHDN